MSPKFLKIRVPKIPLFAVGIALAFPAHSPAGGMNVFVLGTVHKNHLDGKWNYSLQDLRNEIKAIKPDLVCAEIFERDAATPMRAYYPPENAVVEYAAREVNAEFYTADWRGEFTAMVAADNAMTEKEKREYEGAADIKLPLGSSSMFEYLHGKALQVAIKNSHETAIKAGGEVADGYWYARNQMIVKNCIRHAEKTGRKRILFTFGMDHKYIIEEYLRSFYSLKPLPIKRLFTHQNMAMPPEVISTWTEEKQRLQDFIQNPASSPTFIEMVKRSKRLDDLPRFIESKGRVF